jgi:hypothetical protein
MEAITSLQPRYHLFRDYGWNVDYEKEEEKYATKALLLGLQAC